MLVKDTIQQLCLVNSVFFRKIGDVVYVRNVATGEEFVLSNEAWPILLKLRKGINFKSSILRVQRDFILELRKFGLVTLGQEKLETNVCNKIIPAECSYISDNIALRFQEECRKKHLLWSAGLELTYRCNEHCKHCYVDVPLEQKEKDELNKEEWIDVINQLSRMGCVNVLVTGGEPSLHNGFIAICESIVKNGMLCDVYTNGLAINDSLFSEIRKLPLNSISVSLYSGFASFHDEITGVPGSFQKTVDTLLRFKEAGFNTYAKVPIFHEHLNDFFAAKELGEKYGFRTLASTILVPGHSGKTHNSMMMDAIEYRQFLDHEAVPNTCIESTNCKTEPLCHAGQSTLCVSPFGDVMPCNSFPAKCGNVRNTSLARIWRTSNIFKQLGKIQRSELTQKCAACDDIAYCTICPGVSWNETQGAIKPCSWSCEQAHIRAQFNQEKQKGKNNESYAKN